MNSMWKWVKENKINEKWYEGLMNVLIFYVKFDLVSARVTHKGVKLRIL